MSSSIEVHFFSTSRQSATMGAITFPTLVEPRSPPPTKDEAKARIQELYDSGAPIFTKESIREIWEQIQRKPVEGDKIIIRDITGAKLQSEVRVGSTTELDVRKGEGEWMKRTYIYKDLSLSYRCACNLIKDVEDHYTEDILDCVYAPLRLQHHMDEIDSKSENKEIIPARPIGKKEDVARDFDEKRKTWEESETCKKFIELLTSSAGSHEINKVVGLACGSLSLPNNEHAATQHAMLVSVRDWLKSRDEKREVECYIQDPMNTAVDREVLADVGFEVIDDPRGWLVVDEKSVVLSIAPNVPVKEIIADIARPAVVIWYRVAEDDGPGRTDPDSKRVRAMMEDYDLFEIEPYSPACLFALFSRLPRTKFYTQGHHGRFDWLWSRLVQPRVTPTVQEAEAIIDRAYESGVPFFTKQAIRDVWDQIKRKPANGLTVFIKDITGATVACEVETGVVKDWEEDDGTELQYVCMELVIAYDCRACLKRNLEWRFHPDDFAPRTLDVMHVTREWDRDSGEIIPHPSPLDREVVERILNDNAQKWNASPACDKLKTILSSSVKDHEISKIVALSLGSVSIWNKGNDLEAQAEHRSCSRSASQHALLHTLWEWLQGRDHKDKPVCYSQDPDYTEVDKQILGESGIEVIDDPRGWLETDEHSIVFSVASNVPVREIITDIARPAVIIWSRVGFHDGLVRGLTDPDSSRVREMLQGYECHEFGPDIELFSDIVVYVRKSVAAPVAGEDGRFPFT
ncbi:hypothetical protein N7535_008552 [Penicillium sp. DV-2018c]|nr:hypothetical protein N7461_002311 [Penicillium sp. DV-2018c]KAJ5563388.1 hypothetical protein N7535_008552 [Penicillium sp. DV-2018c]